MPAHLLTGNAFLVFHALEDIKKQVGPPELLEANSHIAQAAQTNLAQLRAVCDAVPFLAEHRLMVVEGLLSLFESREPRRRPASAGRGGAAGQGRTGWEELPGYIAREMPPTTLLAFRDDAVSKNNSMLAKLRPVVQVQEFPTPSGEGLARWVRNLVAEKGAQITPGAILLLSQLVGGNLWAMDNELEKLTLYAGDDAINEGDVRLLVSQSREASIFSAVDAILAGRSAAALQMMHRLRDDGVEFPYIVSMIARQLRLATLARDLIDRGQSERAIGQQLGITLQFALKRTVEQARRHQLGTMEWLYGRLLEADVAVKRGRVAPDVALDLLVSEASRPSSPR